MGKKPRINRTLKNSKASSTIVRAASTTLPWQRHKYSLLARQIDVFSAAAQLTSSFLWAKIWNLNSSPQQQYRARRLVNTLVDLGPTFIKIGQSLSTRGDLLPWEYVKALSELQDRVPAFSSQEAIALIESELKNSIHALFREFDPVPIAAASLGQVHKARLHTGEEVVVKVQRPGLQHLLNLDFQALYQLILWVQRYLPWTRKYDLETIHQEFRNLVFQEIDYLQEGKNADRFRENFKGHPRVLVPLVYWQYTTQKVLTLEYLPGIKIDDRATLESIKIDLQQLNTLGISCYLKQLLVDGFFQVDPHPGNMAVDPDGNIIFYDFGMMAEVNTLNKSEMTRSFFAFLRKDTEELIETLISMGLVEPDSDLNSVRTLVQFALDRFRERPIDFQEFNEIKGQLLVMFEQQPFRLPAQMTFILKALGTLDGIARTLDSEYNMLACAKPFVKSLVLTKQSGGVMGELARQARNFVKYKFNQPSAAEVLIQRLETRLERGELQVRVRSPESDHALKRIHLAIKSLMYACLTGFTLLSGAVLLMGPYSSWAVIAFGLTGLESLFLVRSLVELAIREKLDQLAEK
jgi:predicted unusual protein kinase regulating ubiquinone biosynthesis (AarF/ABC1/UbiB family)